MGELYKLAVTLSFKWLCSILPMMFFLWEAYYCEFLSIYFMEHFSLGLPAYFLASFNVKYFDAQNLYLVFEWVLNSLRISSICCRLLMKNLAIWNVDWMCNPHINIIDINTTKLWTKTLFMIGPQYWANIELMAISNNFFIIRMSMLTQLH